MDFKAAEIFLKGNCEGFKLFAERILQHLKSLELQREVELFEDMLRNF